MSNKTQDEVEKFLQDLDVLTVKKPSKQGNASPGTKGIPVVGARSAQSTAPSVSPGQHPTSIPVSAPVTAPEVVQSPIPATTRVTQQTAPPTAPQSMMNTPPVAVQVVMPNVSAAPGMDMTSIGPPPSRNMGMGPPTASQTGMNKQKVKKATHGYVPLAAPVDVSLIQQSIAQEEIHNNSINKNDQNEESQAWNFSSLWSKASQVAESTARVVAGNENVFKIAETVNSNLNKLAETLAPKIEAQHQEGFLADKIAIWLCVEADKSISRDVLKDFTYSTVNELWLNPMNRICKSLRINNVDHSVSFSSNSLPEAIQKTEGMVTGLQKLSDEQLLSPGVDSNLVYGSVILVVQQICLPVSCTLLDDPVHTFFLVTLVCDNPELGFISCSSCSQSIVRPVGVLKADSAWGQWESSQRIRVLETVIGDIIEEFIAKVGYIRQLNTTN